ncbi:MAG TPA: STAS domain-containing protein [Planctomycetota bacterium]|nr:STAS domain-containing protein [Planctomycetota bacterium]
MKLNIEKHQDSDVLVQIVKVDGYLDAHTFPDLEKVLNCMITQGEHNIILDFETLDYISSAGLGLLLGAQRKASQLKGGVKIIHMQESIKRVFQVLGFSRVIEVCPSREAALRAFQCGNSGRLSGDVT